MSKIYKKDDLLTAEIVDMDAEGMGIGKVDGRIVLHDDVCLVLRLGIDKAIVGHFLVGKSILVDFIEDFPCAAKASRDDTILMITIIVPTVTSLPRVTFPSSS